jgi:hypothetical protein
LLKWGEFECECEDKNQISVDIPTKISQPIHMRIGWLFALLFSVLYSKKEPVNSICRFYFVEPIFYEPLFIDVDRIEFDYHQDLQL